MWARGATEHQATHTTQTMYVAKPFAHANRVSRIVPQSPIVTGPWTRTHRRGLDFSGGAQHLVSHARLPRVLDLGHTLGFIQPSRRNVPTPGVLDCRPRRRSVRGLHAARTPPSEVAMSGTRDCAGRARVFSLSHARRRFISTGIRVHTRDALVRTNDSRNACLLCWTR